MNKKNQELTIKEREKLEEEVNSIFERIENSSNYKRACRIPIIQQIENERDAQDAQWGEQNHSPIEWIGILVEEVGEASKNAIQAHFSYAHANSDNKEYDAIQMREYRRELVQVAAVAIAMIECVDRNHFKA